MVYIESIHLHVLSMGHNLRLKNGVKCSVDKHVSKHIAILIARQGVTIQASSDGEGGTSTSKNPTQITDSLSLIDYANSQTKATPSNHSWYIHASSFQFLHTL